MKKYTSVLSHPDHGDHLVTLLANCAKSGAYADVKIVTMDDGVYWTHKVLLASVSPFLKELLLSEDAKEESVITLQLPNTRSVHLSLVLDYMYTGAMYLTPNDLAEVLRVIEVLRMKCGVSVSKMVKQSHDNRSKRTSRRTSVRRVKEECTADAAERWVEEAKFCGLDQLKIKEELITPSEDVTHQEISDATESKEPTEDHQENNEELEGLHEDPIEVKPDHQRATNQEFHTVEEIDEESCSDDEDGLDCQDVDQDSLNHGFEGYKCVMCSKMFEHEGDLTVHIRVHLGAKASLNICQHCGRNFRSSLEIDLHNKSHKYSKSLKHHANKRKLNMRQKILRKYIRRLWISQKYELAPLALTKALQNIRRRTVEKQEKNASAATNSVVATDPFKLKMKVKLDRMESLVLPKVYAPDTPKKAKIAPKLASSKAKRTPVKRSSSNSLSSPSKKMRKEDDMTCPTCDKTFIAKSIFERHLKTYKHGIYDQGSDVSAIPNFIPVASAEQLPHFNTVLQPTMEVGGRQVNKYDCHLCSRVFLRVKDLAKHREKNCSAWSKVAK